MTKKNKIEFHGKKMDLLEARVYLIGLSLGIVKPNLNREEEIDYLKQEEREKEKGMIARSLLDKKSVKDITKRLNEKEYLVKILERKIEAEEKYRRVKYCREHGHKKGVLFNHPSINSKGDTYFCPRCETIYEKSSNNQIINPFGSSSS